MEIDAFYTLLMCCYFYLFQDIPAWILIPGFLRYLYKIYTWLFPKEHFKETKKTYGAIIAGSFFVILILGLLSNGLLQSLLLFIGTIALCTSFFIGFVEYYKYDNSIS